MIRTIRLSWCALLICTTPLWLVGAVGRTAASSGERYALRSIECPDLTGLRAGAAPAPRALDGAERDALRAASRADVALRDLRAGDLTLTDRELQIIGITILVTLILVAIA